MSRSPVVPLTIRGDIVAGDLLDFGVGEAAFRAVDAQRHIDRLVLRDPADLADLHRLSCDSIVDFLSAVGCELSLDTNPHMQAAYALTCAASGLPPTVLERLYRSMPTYFEAPTLHALLERQIGKAYQEEWVEQLPVKTGLHRVRVRAFGARSVHVIAGNVPTIAALSIIRNALARSDAIIKVPSNDPLTAAAILRTMADIGPNHPVTRHVSAAYWRGGDERVERVLYTPSNVDKIIAWGGSASLRHIVRYVQPGIDLITFDPKHSCSLVGHEAFRTDAELETVGRRLAMDIGALNQEACFSARLAYVEWPGSAGEAAQRVNALGRVVFDALQRLPVSHSARPGRIDSELALEVDALRFLPQDFCVFGGESDEGAVIVSQNDDVVDFARYLRGRVANVVPVRDIRDCLRRIDKSVQTVSVYPDSLKYRVRDELALRGVQRIVSLGGAAVETDIPVPQDGLEPLRRLCRWIVEEDEAGETPDR